MKRYAATLSARIERIARPNEGRRLLEIGAAAGCLTIGLQQMGYQCVGIEPDAHALQTAQELSAQLAQPCLVVYGRAERIPFPDECFDIVVSNSVLEHVADIDGCFREVSRVLAPGGTFWFETASSMCPFQHEIRNFPLFGWYPNSLKTRIMIWAANKRPDWVGHTAAPAVNWFSDRTARQKLNQVGFGTIVDRWNLRRETEGGRIYAVALKVIQANPVARRLANIAVSECAYAAIKTR
ncbi:MAG TPA: class I SAM-dependent methyltransferase [Bryobacteraceae bacterium]|nr:class I SAM-dependent methyltransferase [Bryobacteraceae bacterium]